METTPCILCGKEDNPAAIEENGYTGRKCAQCGLIYVSPRPSPEEIAALYEHDRAHFSLASHLAGSRGNRLGARHTIRIIRNFIRKGSVLEIGAGTGYFLHEARRAGFEVFANELNPALAGHIAKHFSIPCSSEPLHDSLFGNRRFDIIYHRDVLSHFYDPIAEFDTMHALLKPGGFLVFETGNGGDISPEYFPLFESFQFPDHLFFFSEPNIRELLRKSGFEFMKCYRYSILLQLWIMKYLRVFLAPVRPGKRSADDEGAIESSDMQPPGLRPHDPIKQIIIDGAYLGLFVFRYIIGAVLPKKRRPQTLIVIARKRA